MLEGTIPGEALSKLNQLAFLCVVLSIRVSRVASIVLSRVASIRVSRVASIVLSRVAGLSTVVGIAFGEVAHEAQGAACRW